MKFRFWLAICIVFIAVGSALFFLNTKLISFKVTSEYPGLNFKVSKILANIFIYKQGYRTNIRTIRVNFTPETQEMYILTNKDDNRVIQSALAVLVGESEAELAVNYDPKILDSLYFISGRMDIDMYAYLCAIMDGKNQGRDSCYERASEFQKWIEKFHLGRMVRMGKKISFSLVKTVYAAYSCTGSFTCGAWSTTGCDCSAGPLYDSQCSTNGANLCGPGAFQTGRCTGCVTSCDTSKLPIACSSYTVQSSCDTWSNAARSCATTCLTGGAATANQCSWTCNPGTCVVSGACYYSSEVCVQGGSNGCSSCTVSCSTCCTSSWVNIAGTRTCPTTCGTVSCLIQQSDGCGSTRWVANGTTCNECEDCSPSCGQATYCGGSCSNADDGVPSTPTCTSFPSEVTSSPQTVSWTSGGTLADTWLYKLNGGAAISTVSLSASVAVNCGTNTWQALARNTSCGTDDSAYSSLCNLCYECGPTFGVWSSCDANHKRTQTCSETCGTDDCGALGAVGGIITEDCTGTITGTLFDASDLSFCPADIGTNPTYASIRFSNETFGITGPWPVISTPVATDVDGNYSESIFAPGTYSYDYTDLYNSGAASGVKFECTDPTVTVMTHGQTVVKDTGFWRTYSGWWQAQGGSVYAGGGVKSDIPGLVVPASNQVLILDSSPALGSRTGVLSYGSTWDGTELGTNPNAKVSSRLWRVQSLYDGLRFDYNYFNTRMNIFDSTVWDGDVINYTGDVAGYQIFKHTGDVTLNYGGPEAGQKVILLIDGNVNINNNLIVPNGAFLAVVARGNITFGSTVTNVEGWFVAESIKVPSGGGVDVQFSGRGSFVGWTMIELKRDMGVTNNTQPAEIFTYRPDLSVNAPVPMKMYSKTFSPFIP